MASLLLAAALFFVPALPEVLAPFAGWREGVSAASAAARLCAVLDAAACFWRALPLAPLGRAAPFGLSPCRFVPRRAPAPGGPPPVVLVHGLYHDPSAWVLFARRLRRAGLPTLFVYRYPSFGTSFAALAADLRRSLAAAAGPDGRVLLVGHSLGGLLVRAAAADPPAGVRPAGIVTLGAPHGGSRLARLGPGRLARDICPGGAALRLLRSLPPAPAPGLSIFSPTDGAVIPPAALRLDRGLLAAGWRQETLRPLSHLGLLYDRAAARRTAAFLLERSAV